MDQSDRHRLFYSYSLVYGAPGTSYVIVDSRARHSGKQGWAIQVQGVTQTVLIRFGLVRAADIFRRSDWRGLWPLGTPSCCRRAIGVVVIVYDGRSEVARGKCCCRLCGPSGGRGSQCCSLRASRGLRVFIRGAGGCGGGIIGRPRPVVGASERSIPVLLVRTPRGFV